MASNSSNQAKFDEELAKYKPAEWPKRIHVEQEGLGGHAANIYDADTGEQHKRVFGIVLRRDKSVVRVTASKYVPDRLAISVLHPLETERSGMDPDPDFGEEVYEGIVVETREYPITRLSLDAGV